MFYALILWGAKHVVKRRSPSTRLHSTRVSVPKQAEGRRTEIGEHSDYGNVSSTIS